MRTLLFSGVISLTMPTSEDSEFESGRRLTLSDAPNRPPAGARGVRRDRSMNMELSRRQFMKGAGAGLAGTTLGAFGFGDVEMAYAKAIRPFKLAGTTETRNTCPYCSVACGVIMYSQGRSEEGREGRDHPHRGRRRPSDQPRHAVPEGRGAARLREVGDAPHQAEDPQAGLRQVRGDLLGRRARPHRAPHEGRSRRRTSSPPTTTA